MKIPVCIVQAGIFYFLFALDTSSYKLVPAGLDTGMGLMASHRLQKGASKAMWKNIDMWC